MSKGRIFGIIVVGLIIVSTINYKIKQYNQRDGMAEMLDSMAINDNSSNFTQLPPIEKVMAGLEMMSKENGDPTTLTKDDVSRIYLLYEKGELESAGKIVKLLQYYADGKPDVDALSGDEVLELYLSLAEKGDNMAQRMVAMTYFGNSDTGKTVYWLDKAARNGDGDAACTLGNWYYYGEGVEKDVEKAIEYFTLGADGGDAECQSSLAVLYSYTEMYSKPDYIKAFKYAALGANAGRCQAQQVLGDLYFGGLGTTKNYELALRWYKKSLEKERVPYYLLMVGAIYADGLVGGTPNPSEAYKYIKPAADQGQVNAIAYLAGMYISGDVIDQDYDKAIKLLRSIEDENIPYVYYYLGVIYEGGLGIDGDLTIANKFYSKAASLGYALAQESLSRLSSVSID